MLCGHFQYETRVGEPELRRAARAGPGPTAACASHFCAPVCSPGVDQRWVCLPRNAVTGGALAGVLAPKEACGAVARKRACLGSFFAPTAEGELAPLMP